MDDLGTCQGCWQEGGRTLSGKDDLGDMSGLLASRRWNSGMNDLWDMSSCWEVGGTTLA